MHKVIPRLQVCADTNFVDYIKKKEEDYLDGADVVSESLMKLALNKYILRKENGEWGSTSSEQEELTALTIEMSRYKTDAENGKRPGKNRSK